MRRFVREEMDFISKIKEVIRSALLGWAAAKRI